MLFKQGSHRPGPASAFVAGSLGWLAWTAAVGSATPPHAGNPATAAKPARTEATLKAEWKDSIQPMLEHYCYDCHGDGRSKGKLDLEQFPDLASMRKNPKIWEHILARVDYRLMPPPRKEQPGDRERHQLSAWINDAIFPADAGDPGHVIMRRLNKTEYQNTLRDLLGIDVQVGDLLPPDDSGHGFDNNGGALTISPVHIEKYLQAAEKALDRAIVLGPMKPASVTLPGRVFKGDGHRREDGVFFTTRGTARVKADTARAGRYVLRVRASASQAGDEPAFLDVSINGKQVERLKVANALGDKKTFTVKFTLPRGPSVIGFTFANDYYAPKAKDPRRRDRNLMVHGATLEGPLGVKLQKPSSHRRIFFPGKPGQSRRAYTGEVLARFARRAFRRPVGSDEINRYLALAERTGKAEKSLEAGVKAALSAMLVSPSFLFIAPDTSVAGTSGSPVFISEHALASRLSYFLWSTMPDRELTALAERGQLRKNLDAQVTRMLRDPRSREMVRHFSGQWLQLRDLETVNPDPKRFRQFSHRLARDMRTETEMLCDHILRGNRSVLEFLSADYSFINDRLARHYRLPGVAGRHFRRVPLTGTRRRGVLTHASVLTLTSQPDRTSPVLRGKFVLENVLDITPPPPPPDLPALEESHDKAKQMTVREQLAMHRKKTACAGCHNLMDPVGLAFENYNAVGAWREFDNGRAIDSSGRLVTGEQLTGAESLRLVILSNKRGQFLRCLTSKLMTYALGRGIDRRDRLHIEKILSDLEKNDYRAHTLIRAVINSVPFQKQRQ